jgi:hypothetical protein
MAYLDDRNWNGLLHDLQHRRVPSESVHTAIVRLAKPYDEQRIWRAKDVVAYFLNDNDPWVRHEALWFLASWGRLTEYEPQAVEMMLHDPFEDNRGFAANCLGILRAKHGEGGTLDVLRVVVLNEREAEQVRVKAYAAMRKIAGGDAPLSLVDLFDFEIGGKRLHDIDWSWVSSSSSPG